MSFKKPKEHTDLSCDDKKQSNVEDDGFTDSGIMSGQNLSCEQFDSGEINADIEAEEDNVDFDDNKRFIEDKERYVAVDSGLIVDVDGSDTMRIDSGVDVGVTDSFSNLKLENENRNNLSCEHAPLAKDIPLVNVVDIDSDSPKESELPPWYLYFEQDDEGDTQLHIAIIQGYTEAVWALLKMCPHPSLLDIRNDIAQTPLHLAVLTAQPHIVRGLVLAGAKVNSRDCDGNTPLHLATVAADTACLRALICPPSHTERTQAPLHLPHALDQKNYDGETCTHLAAMGGHIDVLKMLVYYGADINAREGKSGRTPLHIAVQINNPAIVSYLISECRTLMLTVRTYAGYTAKRLAPPTLFDLLPGSESDDEYDSEDDEDEYDSSDEEMQFGDALFFSRSIKDMGPLNVAC